MKPFFFIIITFCLTLACNNGEKTLLKNIKLLEANKSLATSDTLINSYVNFSNQFPKHPFAVKFLFKAAEATVKAGRYEAGAKLYEQLANNYKDSSLAPESLLRAGFNYQSINDVSDEKRVFIQFLNNYPKHDRVNDIKMSLEIIDYTPQQQDSILMDRILRNNSASE